MPARLVAFAMLISAAARAGAGPPAGAFDQLRAEAEVVVTVRVTSVREEVRGANKDVTVTATVLGVERTAFGTKPGEGIRFAYTDAATPPGSAPMPTLEKDGVYPAFLRRTGKTYEPAAGAASFRMTPEGVQAKGNKTGAERLGGAMLAVDRLLAANLADEKADDLQAAVVRVGQSGEPTWYLWVRARLWYEGKSLGAREAELGKSLTPAGVKEIDARVAFLTKTAFLVDAPR